MRLSRIFACSLTESVRRTSELQIVLMGHPELLDRLAAHNLRQLRERISTKVSLLPLSPIESVAYVNCRLEAEHGTPQIFDAKALRASRQSRRRNSKTPQCSLSQRLGPRVFARRGQGDAGASREKSSRTTRVSSAHPNSTSAASESRSAEATIHPRRPLIRAVGACAAVAVIGLGSVSIPTVHNWAGALTRTAPPIAGSAPASPEATSASGDQTAATLGYTASTADASVVAIPSDPTKSAPSPDFTAIQIHAGDTFHDLAAKYLGSKDRARELIKDNPQISNPNVLYVGETIYVPSTHVNDQAREVR